MSIKENIINGMRILDEDIVLNNAAIAISEDVDRSEILNWLNLGMAEVGKLYESEEYYIVELIMSEIIYKKVLDLEEFDVWTCKDETDPLGIIVLGTVNGDNHDIGKNIFKSMVEASGFKVIDLGVDVTAEFFIDNIKKIKPDILALSGILTSAIDEMKLLIERLEEENLRSAIKVIVGGPALSAAACTYVGADISVNEAALGVEICKHWIKEAGL